MVHGRIENYSEQSMMNDFQKLHLVLPSYLESLQSAIKSFDVLT
jgi:hypothetical protein